MVPWWVALIIGYVLFNLGSLVGNVGAQWQRDPRWPNHLRLEWWELGLAILGSTLLPLIAVTALARGRAHWQLSRGVRGIRA